MTVYRIPARDGVPVIELPSLVEKDKNGKIKKNLVKNWIITSEFIEIETTKEIDELEDYKI